MIAGVLSGQIALVTGAGRGLGRAVALELARRGAHLVATARTQGGLEELDDEIAGFGGAMTLLPMDLADGEAVDRLGPSLFQRFEGLDIFVHCAAAFAELTPVAHLVMKNFHNVMAVNLDGTLRLIRTLDPLLRASAAGRVVVVRDGLVGRPTAYWGGYGTSKAAQAHLVMTWAEELRSTRCRVNLFTPPPMATRLRRMAFPGENQAMLSAPEHFAGTIADLCGATETRHGVDVAG